MSDIEPLGRVLGGLAKIFLASFIYATFAIGLYKIMMWVWT